MRERRRRKKVARTDGWLKKRKKRDGRDERVW